MGEPVNIHIHHTSSTDGDGIMKKKGGRERGERGGGGGSGEPERRWHGQVAGGKDQGAQLPGSGSALASRLFVKSHTTRTPKPDDAKMWGRKRGRRGRATETRRNLNQANLPGTYMDLGAGRGRKKGE